MENRTAETEEKFDGKRIRHLLKLGIFSACMVMLGDVLLGWGVSDPKVTEIPRMFTRFLSVSDACIYVSAMLGLILILSKPMQNRQRITSEHMILKQWI